MQKVAKKLPSTIGEGLAIYGKTNKVLLLLLLLLLFNVSKIQDSELKKCSYSIFNTFYILSDVYKLLSSFPKLKRTLAEYVLETNL